MSQLISSSARRLGIVSAAATVVLSVAYAVPLTAGLMSLPSPDAPIGEPWFAMMEILIILSMPAMVALMIAIHAWAPPGKEAFAALAVAFMALTTVVTCSVHFVILTVSHRSEFADQSWLPSVLSFRWLSITYALDILAWDVFFAISVLSAAAVFSGGRLARSIRLLLTISGVLALAGLAGVVVDDAHVRNIGIAGYAGVFPVAALLLVIVFHRADTVRATADGQQSGDRVPVGGTHPAPMASSTPSVDHLHVPPIHADHGDARRPSLLPEPPSRSGAFHADSP
jgi:hypothetical protein